jgi:hypothetical protein
MNPSTNPGERSKTLGCWGLQQTVSIPIPDLERVSLMLKNAHGTQHVDAREFR